MNIQIVSRTDNARDDDRRYAEKLTDRLRRYFRGIVYVQWTLSVEGGIRTASCALHAESGFYHAESRGISFRESVDLVFRQVLKQRRRRKAIARRQIRTAKNLRTIVQG